MIRSSLVTLAFVIASTGFAADPKPETVVGTKAPQPKLTNLDGKAVGFDTLRGKAATVVVFASFECPVSNSYATLLNDLGKSHAEKGVAVVIVCPSDDAPAAVAKASAGFKLSVPVVLDPKRELAAGLKAVATPEAFVLDGEGVVRYRGRIDDAYSARLKRNPMVTSHELTDALAAVLSGKPVAKPVTAAVGCAIEYETAAPVGGAVTFYKDVQAILNANCVVCHRQGEVGPFPLSTYNQARRWASDIKDYTANRQMPPWMPAGGVAMKGERKLTEKEIATLAVWADAGAPEGNVKDAPKAPDFGEGWRYGKPDLILTPGEDFRLAAVGDDLFRVFVVPTGLTENKWVIGYDVKPGNPRVVHHTLHYFDTTGQGRGLEKKQLAKDEDAIKSGKILADGGPGYTASMGVGFVAGGGTRDAPTFGGLGGWAPGQMGQFLPNGMGWLLPKGSDFLIQTHYHRNGQPARDRTQIGLYFAKGPIDQPWQSVVVNGMKPNELIPAGKVDHVARGAFYLHSDAILHNVLPHMHLLGKTTKVTMTPPGGKPIVLVEIPAWDYKWQETYWFKEPIHAKAGTKLEIEAVFDNSTSNPNNPTSPPKNVKVGEQTTDEMLFGFFGVTSTKTPWEAVRTSAFPTPGVLKPTAPIKGQMTPELERRLGEWDSSAVIKALGGPETKRVGMEKIEKAFDGTYLLIQAETDGGRDGNKTYELVTFDPVAKNYRMWTYTAQGSIYEWEGAWDDATRSINFSAPISGDLKGAMKWDLAAEDTFVQELKVKVGFVNAFSSTATMTRKKK